MQINLPIRLSVCRQRQIFPCLFSSHAFGQTSLIDITSRFLKFSFSKRQNLSFFYVDKPSTTLPVFRRLKTPPVLRCPLCSIYRNRVPSRVFIYVSSSMSDPLPPYIHWCSDMKFDLAHLKGGRVRMPHEISNQTSITLDTFSAAPIRNPRCLYDSGVISHVVDEADKPFVKNF